LLVKYLRNSPIVVKSSVWSAVFIYEAPGVSNDLGIWGDAIIFYKDGGIPIDVQVIIGDSAGIFAFGDQNYIWKEIYGPSTAHNAGKFYIGLYYTRNAVPKDGSLPRNQAARAGISFPIKSAPR